jgi:hypothetical protein
VCLHLIGGKLPLDKPLENRKTPIQVLEIQLGLLVDLHDFWSFSLWWLLPFCTYRGRVLIAHEDPVWHRLAT